MNKAILVLNMPIKCEECCCYIDDYKHSFLCRATNKKVDTEANKPYWCPLKPMPQRKEFDNQIPYEKGGWNDCIDEIEGKENKYEDDSNN